MNNITELLDQLASKFAAQRENIVESQLEILTRLFSDNEEELRRLSKSGIPLVIILGPNLAILEPVLSQLFKTHVSPFLRDNQFVITIDFELLPERMPSLYHENPYWAAHHAASPWFEMYRQLKKNKVAFAHTSP